MSVKCVICSTHMIFLEGGQITEPVACQFTHDREQRITVKQNFNRCLAGFPIEVKHQSFIARVTTSLFIAISRIVSDMTDLP
ncbi:hypothetical protein KIN20_006840 [Parelaphostrongylus tenuis]|uniref:Uncharacterized protein n=1 Tax=Parelaphostrongylus tenuis TaxID=148309 RepID=A0AAD5QH84_PARTN|nr:hypothetical protein KIN20_006840 [Parelaphostrongylus tenuis]